MIPGVLPSWDTTSDGRTGEIAGLGHQLRRVDLAGTWNVPSAFGVRFSPSFFNGLSFNTFARKPLGASELVDPLLSLSSLSAPLISSTTNPNTLGPSEIEPFLQDLTRRFEPENELDGILGPVVRLLLFHISLFRPEGLGGGDSIWRGVIGGLEALVSVKSIAVMITRLPEWLPANVTASNFERVTLMGPLCRLGVFGREWVSFICSLFVRVETMMNIAAINCSVIFFGSWKTW